MAADSPLPPDLRVLVVEDDAAARDAIRRGLIDRGAEVLEASDGLAALEQVASGDPALVVLDLMLPMLDGEHVISRLRRMGPLPVIVVSAKRSPDDRVRALDLGADDYLVKPFTMRELVARIRAVLRRSGSGSDLPVGGAAIDLDAAAQVALRDGRRVPLTAQEFAVLEQLVARRGSIVSRQAIEAALHPEGGERVSNLVDVLILRLRKKLGRDLITTRRGQGFIIDS
ncbi:MAG: response regulator transcription factor [Planctomycetota bacterium]|nr:response regulator transcription factor [Planctomycetota bacterium]